MRHRLLAVFALFGASLGPQVHASQDLQSPEFQAALKERVTLLSARPEPEAWLLAAWLAGSWCQHPEDCGNGQVRVLGERLLSNPPADPVALRILIMQLPKLLAHAPAQVANERDKLLLRLQRLDPEHLQSWLLALPDPKDADAWPEAERILARAAMATHTASDFTPAFRWARKHLAVAPSRPSTAEEAALIEAEGISMLDEEALALAAALAIPAYSHLAQWCRADTAVPFDHCRAVSRLMTEKADSLIERSIGASLLLGLARDQAEREQAGREKARVHWYMKAMGACSERAGRAILAAYAEDDGNEVATVEALLLAHGLPLDPPADPPEEIGCEMVSEPN